jgi:hypothetical protein
MVNGGVKGRKNRGEVFVSVVAEAWQLIMDKLVVHESQ